MRTRPRSTLARARDAAPVVVVVGAGIVGVFVAMNVLVVAAPVAVDVSSGPSTSPTPTFAETPSVGPLDSPSDLETPVPSVSLPSTRPTLINAVVAGESKGVWSYHLVYPALLEGTTPWAAEINADIYGGVQARALQWAGGPAANPRASGKVNSLTGTYRRRSAGPWDRVLHPDLGGRQRRLPGLDVETVNFDLARARGSRSTLSSTTATRR